MFVLTNRKLVRVLKSTDTGDIDVWLPDFFLNCQKTQVGVITSLLLLILACASSLVCSVTTVPD